MWWRDVNRINKSSNCSIEFQLLLYVTKLTKFSRTYKNYYPERFLEYCFRSFLNRSQKLNSSFSSIAFYRKPRPQNSPTTFEVDIILHLNIDLLVIFRPVCRLSHFFDSKTEFLCAIDLILFIRLRANAAARCIWVKQPEIYTIGSSNTWTFRLTQVMLLLIRHLCSASWHIKEKVDTRYPSMIFQFWLVVVLN